MSDIIDRLVCSQCSCPWLKLEPLLAACSRIGYRKLEVFTSWTESRLDIEADPAAYLALGERYRMRFTSLHLPPVARDGEISRAVRAARFAEALGVEVVLFKAADRRTYVAAAGPFLDATEGLTVTPVLQNHFGTPISTLEDLREVIDGIGDARMRTLLEVGQFHSAGVHWRDAAELLGGSIALVHVKDQVGSQSVPFGAGEIDLPGLLACLEAAGYDGDFVVEMEAEDEANRLGYLADAVDYFRSIEAEGRDG